MNVAVWLFLANVPAFAYPESAENILKRPDIKKETCFLQESGREIAIYKKDGDEQMVWVFLQNNEELELWIYDGWSLFRFGRPDKIYYKVESGEWKDKDRITRKEARRLDARIKFSDKEKEWLDKCFRKKIKAP